MIKFNKMFALLVMRDMKKTDLLPVVSSATLARFSNGGMIRTDTINNVCAFLGVQPGDIMEYVPDSEAKR